MRSSSTTVYYKGKLAKRVNTPTFGLKAGVVLARKYAANGSDYRDRLQLLSTIVKLVAQTANSTARPVWSRPRTKNKSSWLYCRGFLADKQVYKLSVLSRQLSEVANKEVTHTSCHCVSELNQIKSINLTHTDTFIALHVHTGMGCGQ